MDFFCVRKKPRHIRRNKKEEDKRKHKKENTSPIRIVRVEARPQGDLVRTKKREKHTHRASRAMPSLPRTNRWWERPNTPTNVPTVDVPALDEERPCQCPCCRTRRNRPTYNGDANPQSTEDRAWEIRNSMAGMDQLYAHPYSIKHYRFPVVNCSYSYRDHSLAPHPSCSMVIVPEAATPRDIETALAGRPGLVAMARLLEGGNLVRLNTFSDVRNLHQRSLQLEIWDSSILDR
ncbi:hypothetical protein GGS24DRAFT_222817 [Hypoxylon argillaceum]|nr:hypothetical protein GGS24DRAFT_222817 [Hypoxylon argillaceum]KAI1156585.1 hypothetical protein F4825DRAFT_262717 [Nemania diffusa]